jgi:hypothetical protein
MTREELVRGTEAAWKYAYRWSSMFRRLWHSPAPWHVSWSTNLGYRYYAHRLHRFYTCDVPVDPWAGRSRQPAAVGAGSAP